MKTRMTTLSLLLIASTSAAALTGTTYASAPCDVINEKTTALIQSFKNYEADVKRFKVECAAAAVSENPGAPCVAALTALVDRGDLLDDGMDQLHVSAGEQGCKRAQRKLVRAIRSIEETIEQVEDYI